MTSTLVNFFPACVLIVVLYDLRRNHTMNDKARWFQLIVIFTLGVLLSDVAARLLEGQTFAGARELLLSANLIYFALSALVSYSWFMLAFFALYGGKVFGSHRVRFFLVSLPMFLFFLILFLRTDWIISITPDNLYQRGPYFFIQSAVGLGYMLLGCLRALIHGLREHIPARRREDLLLASLVLYPFAGALTQLTHMHLVTLWPLTVVAILLFHLSLRHDDIQKDELTGVFNRRWLDEFLTHAFAHAEKKDGWQLLLIDLDRLKPINDAHGHAAGDEVLRRAANILQEVFSQRDAAIARYGGDEFAVILKRPVDVRDYARRLQEAAQRSNAAAGLPYELSLSVGGAAFRQGEFERLEDFVARADQNMYRNKQENRPEG